MTTPDSSSQPAQRATSPSASPNPTPTPLPARGPAGDVYVLFTRELAEQLTGTYSDPVQLQLLQVGNEWTAVARTHVCPTEPPIRCSSCLKPLVRSGPWVHAETNLQTCSPAAPTPCAGGCVDPAAHAEGAHDV